MLKDCKVYPLNAKEQEKLNEFLKEHLMQGLVILTLTSLLIQVDKKNLIEFLSDFCILYIHIS